MTTAEINFAETRLPPVLAGFVRRFVVRSRRLAVFRALGLAISFMLIWTLLWALADRMNPLTQMLRVLLLCVQSALGIALLWRPSVRLLWGAIPWRAAADEIEARDAGFGGGLETSISQWLAPVAHRASPALVQRITADATQAAESRNPASLLPAVTAARPLLIGFAAVLVTVALCFVSWLDMPRLLDRELMPWRGTTPVTTTRIHVLPGSTQVIQGNPLPITAKIERLGDSQPVLRWRGQDSLWSNSVMTASAGEYAYTLPALANAIQYEVQAGDAVSARFDVRVINRPAVDEFHVHYIFPGWTGSPPADLTNATGIVEAPVGTHATVTVYATEPLQSATATVDGASIDSTPTVEPIARSFEFTVNHAGSWMLDLANVAGVHGTGPSSMQIKAIAAAPPTVRLILTDDQRDLRLDPRDVLPLRYEASDAYGLKSLELAIEVNAAHASVRSTAIAAGSRSQSGAVDVDLAQLNVSVGDSVTLTASVTNTAGIRAVSQPCRILVSAHSFDLNALARAAELRAAVELAQGLTSQIAASASAIEASPAGDAKAARDEQVAPHLAAADSAAGELTRTLLRAMGHSDSDAFSNSMAQMLDQLQRCTGEIEQADAQLMIEPRETLLGRLHRASGVGDSLLPTLMVLYRGERAVQLLTDDEELGLHTQQRDVDRARTELVTGCKELGIDANAADHVAQLQQRVTEAVQTAQRAGHVDYAGAADRWSHNPAEEGAGFVARLTVASQGQAIRPGGDFVWARDLMLAAEAARNIDLKAAQAQKSVDGKLPRDLFPSCVATLQQVYERNREPLAPELNAAAERARSRLRQWAGEKSSTQPTTAPSDLAALEAAALEAQKRLDAIARQNRSDAASVTATQPATTQPGTADSLESLSAEQRRIRRETEHATDVQLAKLAQEQDQLSQNIARERTAESSEHSAKSTPDSREQAMDAMRSVQERLSEMSRQLDGVDAAAQQMAEVQQWRDGVDDAEKPAVQQLADDLQQAVEGAMHQTSPDDSTALASRLLPFAPEASPAVSTIEQQLTPALSAMRQAQSAADAPAIHQNTQAARQAINATGRQLADALKSVQQRDALDSARWFSKQAAEEMRKHPMDRTAALEMQQGAVAALEKALDSAVHQSAAARASAMPSLSGTLHLYSSDAQGGGATGGQAPPAPREWGKLREKQTEDLTAAPHVDDPVEYQDALRAYFRALAKDQGGGR